MNFSCRPEEVDQVKEFLKKIRTIGIPTTGHVAVGHGGHERHTRYNIKQHNYAAGGRRYIEVLEIKNPPERRCGIVINEYDCGDSAFTEWETLENARNAFKRFWGICDTLKEFPKLEGFKRSIVCNGLTPWFYAIGDQELIGDYAFPDGLQDDPVYRFGRKFVVFDIDGISTIKICMGTRFLTEDGSDGYGRPKKYYKRLVYWDDGSTYSPDNSSISARPLEEGEMWINEAVQQFKKFLIGKTSEFFINFINGDKFVGRLLKTKNRVSCVEGSYYLVVKMKNKEKVIEGWVSDFKPTQDDPDIIQYATNRLAKGGVRIEEIEKIEIKDSKTKKGGKKWSGVFFNLTKE